MSNVYYTGSGNTIHLDKKIGHGGEGEIYVIHGYPSDVAKIYIKQQPPEVHRKILAMVQNPPHDPTVNGPTRHRSIAWPSDVLYTDRQKTKFAGLIMPKVGTKTYKPILKYLVPELREKEFAGLITWEHLYYIARNLASCIAALHERGYLIGDINESNILVHEQTILTIIDCDSFQFKDPRTGELFRCKFGKGEYTAPELLGIKFADIDRTEATDCFALSVIIFRLLMEGIGPYQAVGSLVDNLSTPEDKIKLGIFPYTTSKSGIAPKPDAPSFDIFPAEIRTLFIRCFDAEHKDPFRRPTAKEWLSVLWNLRQNIKQCTINGNHKYFNHLQSCPWCDRAKKDSFPSPVGLQVPILDPNNPAITRQDMEAYLLSLIKMCLMDGYISPEEEAFLIDQGLKLHISEKDTKKYIAGEVQKRGVSLITTGTGKPKLEISKTSFDFPNVRKGSSITDSFIISNVGGGTLSGTIKTNKKWLKVSQSNIDTSRHKQDIMFYVAPSILPFGFKDTGTIEIQSNSGTETVFINVSIEMPEADVSRFRRSLTLAGLILGGLFGYLVYNLSFIRGMNVIVANIAGIVALISAVIVGGEIGYRAGGGGSAFRWGCGTLIVGFIILKIPADSFPHAFSTVAWALAYGSLANMLSRPVRKALWRADKRIPIAAGAGALVLTILIIIGGYVLARHEREAELARSQATQRAMQATRSKLPGEWHGNVGNIKAKLLISQESNQLSGKMIYQGVEEKLSIELKSNDGQIVIVLKGTSYKRVKGKGSFSLDTFYGTLSSDGRSVKGKYVDTARRKGEWSVSKLFKDTKLSSQQKGSSVPRTGRVFVETESAGAKLPGANTSIKESMPKRKADTSSTSSLPPRPPTEEARPKPWAQPLSVPFAPSPPTEEKPAADDSVPSLPPPPTW